MHVYHGCIDVCIDVCVLRDYCYTLAVSLYDRYIDVYILHYYYSVMYMIDIYACIHYAIRRKKGYLLKSSNSVERSKL